MSPEAEQVLEDSLSLPAKERARLARELIASLDDAGDADAEAEWRLEIERRARDLRDGRVELRDWAEVRREILTRLDAR